MKTRATAVLIVVFFAGLIGLWWLDYARVPDRDTARLSEPRVLPELWEKRPDDVRQVEITGGPQRLVFERRPGNRWQMIEPRDVAADPSLVENLAFNLKMLERVRDAGTRAGNSADFGLDPPVRSIRVYGPDGTKPIAGLDVGGTAAKDDKRFVRALDSKVIEVVEAARLGSVLLPAESWRDRMLVRLVTTDVDALAASRGDGRALKVERRGDLWKMTEPFTAVADHGRIDGLLAEVTGLRVANDGFIADDVRDLAPYGLDRPSVTVTLTPRGVNAAPRTIHIGKPAPVDESKKDKVKGTRFYARRDDQDDVVVVDASILKDLGLRPADLHAKKVSDVVPDRVTAIRLTSEGVPVVVVRRPRGWERVAPLKDRADSQAVADVLTKVASAEASVLMESGSAADPRLEKPWATLEVWQAAEGRPANAGEAIESAPAAPPSLAIHLGRRDVLAKTVFAQVAGDPVVMALPIGFLDGWTFGGLAFRDRRMVAISPPSLARIAVKQGDKEVVVEAPRDGNPARWRLAKPADAPADPETVGRALLALSTLRAATLVTDRSEADAKYGLGHPVLTVTWKTRDEPAAPPLRPVEGEETTLAIGSVIPGVPNAPRYARVSSSPIVFTLPADVVALFEAEWRDRHVFALDPKTTERLTLRWPTLALNAHPVAAKEGEPDWPMTDPPPKLKADTPAQLKTLAKALARLTTFRYVQHSGPISPGTGLFPARVLVEAKPAGVGRTRTLRIGRVTRDGYLYATTEETPSGAVFLLPLSQWAPWLRPPLEEEREAAKKDEPAKKEAAAK